MNVHQEKKIANNPPRRTKLLPVAVITVLLSTLLAAFNALTGDDTGNTETTYFHKVAPFTLAEQSNFIVKRRLTGIISARQHADIGFEQGGKVAKVHVDEGDTVTPGTLLAELDTELLHIEARQLRARLADAQSRLKLAKSSLKRQQDLSQRGFSSEQRLDELHAEEASLAATIASIKASQASVQSRLEKAVLRAPFEGMVTRRFSDQGTVVGAGMPVIRLQEEGSMEAHVGVPIQLLPHFEGIVSGDALPIEINSTPAQARLLTISADMNPVTRTVSARLALPRTRHTVNGDLMTLLINEQIDKPGFWVPVNAITDGMRGLWTLYVLAPTGQQHQGMPIYRIESRDIQVEYASATQVFVQGSLNNGELIVHGGLNRFAPGQRVILASGADTLKSASDTPQQTIRQSGD